MVRHHVKKKKTKKVQLSKEELERQKSQAQAQKDEALSRFAGSSEEEDNNGSDVDDYEEDILNGTTPETKTKISENSKKRKKPDQTNYEESDSGEEKEEDAGYSSAESSSDGLNSDDEYIESNGEGPMFLSSEAENAIQNPNLVKKTSTQVGMAGAMSRILGGPSASGKSMDHENVILSKTKTPLQKLQLKEKQRRLEAREIRNEHRSERLTCMHVPLLAATTFQMSDSDKSMSKELELERIHRRVATRGVVALFNAITQHQQSQMAQQLQSKENVIKTKNKDAQNISKKGFLDMIKSKGAGKEEEEEKENSTPKEDGKDKLSKQNSKDKTSSSGGWNALKDDFMMNSKLKDWDKDVTSSSEDEGQE